MVIHKTHGSAKDAYLSTILLDSILVNSNNKHHPQIFLEKCLYAVNKDVLVGKNIDKSNN